ncbi:Pectinesterase, catalytic [Sesbania bispinosa]|nr:Pectinesterase, catalytic [Sesbania bispinosa]
MRTQELAIIFLVLGCALTQVSMSEAVLGGHPKHDHYECNFTRYPNLCAETLRVSGLGSGNQNVDIIQTLVNKTIFETNLPTSYFAEFKTQDAQQTHSVADYCEELMSMSLKRLDQSLKALKSPTRNKNDIQTWLSASLTFQQACKDHVDAHTSKLSIADDDLIMDRMSKKMDYLSKLGSNSLALVNRITNNAKSGNEKEHESFPEWVSSKGRKLLQGASTIKANVIVAQDGTGNYKTVSEAIEVAPGTRFVIYVKAGIYKEKIRVKKDAITGDGFIARDIGFHNNAGPRGEQAVALLISSDRSVLYRCSIVGYQDTLYALSLRQFYKECDIYGTIDFIFGNAAAVFQSCNLVLRHPYGKGYNVILANGRTDPGQNTGFSVHKCVITTSSDFSHVKHSYSSFLGRPWKEYSRSVVMESTIDDAIAGRGWIEWPGYGSSVLKTLYYAEYANEGPGAGTAKRVQWPGFHVVGAEEAAKFTVANFIGGSSWIPSSEVTFLSGLN